MRKTLPRKPTIYDIKNDTAKSSPFFFDHKTMRFFGQVLADFHVSRTDDFRVFCIQAESRGGHVTERYYAEGRSHGWGVLVRTFEDAVRDANETGKQ